MVVTTAIVTIIVNSVSFSMPSESPIVATITSVEPRAFIPEASAKDSLALRPPIFPPTKAPANLPMLAIANERDCEKSKVPIL